VSSIPKAIYEQTVRSFFAPVLAFLDDPRVSEVMINGPRRIYVERAGKLELTGATFPSDEALLAGLRNLSQYIGKIVDQDHPILEGRLPDGSRVEAVLPPVSPDGAMVSIRRFARDTLTIDRLMNLGSLTPAAVAALRAFVGSRLNIIISGGTGSGKTSLLNALTGLVSEGERVIVIEDAREIQPQQEHVLQFEARAPDPKGLGGASIRELFRASLRMRPDRIIVGEIRGGEALDIVQAMLSGHGGCMGTLHASHPVDAMTRLETMAMMNAVELPLAAMRSQIGSAVNLVIQAARLADGTRKITHISEVAGFDVERQRYRLSDLFVRDFSGIDGHGSVKSELVPTGNLPRFMPQLIEHGHDLPEAMKEAKQRGAGAHRTDHEERGGSVDD
jgi:pilus assembly protein CpaF